jgi:phage terminase small subunit
MKQENFCHNIIKGMTTKDAYINAYDTKCSEQVAYNEACKLLKREDIQKRIADIKKPLEIKTLAATESARDTQIKAIRDRIAVCIAKEDETSLIRYYDMLNKIYALYKESDPVQQKENNISNMTNETLLKLVE